MISAFNEGIASFEEKKLRIILEALELAEEHSAGAAGILLDLGMDADTIIAALIRRLPEDSLDRFGPEAALLAGGVKKIDSLKTGSKTIHEAQNIRNMIFALTGDIREIFIKLAEKLYAMRYLDSFPDDERKTAARECLDIYAPLADRLGISWIKNEMEDLSLKFLNREVFQQIKDMVAEKLVQRTQFLEFAADIIKAEAEAAGIKVEVESRAKHFYSIYMKMRRRGKAASEIYDLSGTRIICNSTEKCYTLLGIVHRNWKPVDGCLRDYIANPKPNGYQSLHTTVMFDEGKALEIQIRTGEMHWIAENGVASHWLYKKGSSRDVVDPQDIGIINKLQDWKQSEKDAWLQDIKDVILRDWIYVFTPQGKVIKLPAGATPLDFAYQIHTAVGEHCIGAKANGSIIPLGSQLKSTQVVEILTSQSAHPHFNWLQMAKDSKTRSRIRSWLEKNDETFISGKSHEAKKTSPPLTTDEQGQTGSGAVPSRFEIKSPTQMIIHPLQPFLQVRIGNEKNIMIHFARCCNPVTGDPILGYVSRGRGIIIHRKNCTNLTHNPEFEKRKIEAEWDNADSLLVKRFRIEAKFSANLFSEIEGAVRKRQGHLIEGRLEESAGNRLSGIFTIQLAQADDLKPVMKNIRGIPGMIDCSTLA